MEISQAEGERDSCSGERVEGEQPIIIEMAGLGRQIQLMKNLINIFIEQPGTEEY